MTGKKKHITIETRLIAELIEPDGTIAAKTVHVIDDELRAALKEIEQQTDRGYAIMMTSIVDNYLKLLLLNRLNPLTKKEVSDLFDGNAPLTSFAAKVNLGYALGLYSDACKRAMHSMRRIRNIFAHHIAPLTFSDDTIKEAGSGLISGNIFGSTDLKFRFFISGFMCVVLFKILMTYDLRVRGASNSIAALREGGNPELQMQVAMAFACLNADCEERLFSSDNKPP